VFWVILVHFNIRNTPEVLSIPPGTLCIRDDFHYLILYIVIRNQYITFHYKRTCFNIIPSLLTVVGGGAVCLIRIQQSQNSKNHPEFQQGAIFFFFLLTSVIYFRKIFINVGPASHNSYVLEPNV
jgi:hypothetical protein